MIVYVIVVVAILLFLLLCLCHKKKALPPNFISYYLPVSDIHSLYIEQFGNPYGIPIVYIHGGPGGSILPSSRDFFDAKKFNVVLFDQRGCGRSTPQGCLEENTTWDLVSDMENIRKHIGFSKLHLFGGSWGSALSLIYTIQHPEKVLSLTLRGIFLARQQDFTWYYQDGANQLFPDVWQDFIQPFVENQDNNVHLNYLRQYFKAFSQVYYNKNTIQHLGHELKGWKMWDSATSTLFPSPMAPSSEDVEVANSASILCHYVLNNCWLPSNNWILENIKKAVSEHNIVTTITQGRYDVICPASGAWSLFQTLGNSCKLFIVQDAGHAAMEKHTKKNLITQLHDI